MHLPGFVILTFNPDYCTATATWTPSLTVDFFIADTSMGLELVLRVRLGLRGYKVVGFPVVCLPGCAAAAVVVVSVCSKTILVLILIRVLCESVPLVIDDG